MRYFRIQDMGRAGLAVSLLFLFFAGGCATSASPPPKIIPFELVDGHIYVRAIINGEGPYSFVVDTGAAHTILSPRAAVSTLIERREQSNVFGFGPTTLPITALRRVTLGLPGDVQLPLGHVDEAPGSLFDYFASASGRELDGILGYDLFARYVVEIDPDAQALQLHEPATFRYRGRGAKLKLKGHQGIARVPVGIIANSGDKPVQCWLTVDTGAAADIVLCKPFLERHSIDTKISVRASQSGGVGGTMIGTTGRIAGVQLGPFDLGGFYAEFSRDSGKVGDGVLGQGILLRFKVFVDYTHGLLILEPRKNLPSIRRRDQSGIVLMAEGPALRAYRLEHVFADSPAEKAGLRHGDKLISIDSRPASELTLDAIRDRFRSNERCPVTIQRDGFVIETVIELQSRD
jgi:hypothetical protein